MHLQKFAHRFVDTLGGGPCRRCRQERMEKINKDLRGVHNDTYNISCLLRKNNEYQSKMITLLQELVDAKEDNNDLTKRLDYIDSACDENITQTHVLLHRQDALLNELKEKQKDEMEAWYENLQENISVLHRETLEVFANLKVAIIGNEKRLDDIKQKMDGKDEKEEEEEEEEKEEFFSKWYPDPGRSGLRSKPVDEQSMFYKSLKDGFMAYDDVKIVKTIKEHVDSDNMLSPITVPRGALKSIAKLCDLQGHILTKNKKRREDLKNDPIFQNIVQDIIKLAVCVSEKKESA